MFFGKKAQLCDGRRSTKTLRRMNKAAPVCAGPLDGITMDDLETLVNTEAEAAEGDSTAGEFEAMLQEFNFGAKLGERVTGTIFDIDNSGAYVDIGAKAAAFCPKPECCLAKVSDVSNALQLGSEREFAIIREDDNEGSVTLSLRRIELEVAWKRLQQLHAADAGLTGKVCLINRGGVVVEVEHLRGFVPTSHMSPSLMKLDNELVGKEIPLKFLEVDQETARVVLSNKRAAVDKDLKGFKVGDVVEGVVSDIKAYGAFVDIGGVNGLLHISQISHERISDVDSVLTAGDKIKVMILSQDRERGRVSLSTRKLEPTPGDMVRNPQKVYEKADEMAASFRERVAAAEAAARAEEKAALAAGGYDQEENILGAAL